MHAHLCVYPMSCDVMSGDCYITSRHLMRCTAPHCAMQVHLMQGNAMAVMPCDMGQRRSNAIQCNEMYDMKNNQCN